MKFKLLVIVAVLTLVGSGLAESDYLHAYVPFQFVVDGVVMHAGQYQIERTDEEGILALAGPSRTVLVPTDSANAVGGAPQSELMFTEYGGKYYLSQIWAEGEAHGYNIPLDREKLSLVAQKGATVQVAAAR